MQLFGQILAQAEKSDELAKEREINLLQTVKLIELQSTVEKGQRQIKELTVCLEKHRRKIEELDTRHADDMRLIKLLSDKIKAQNDYPGMFFEVTMDIDADDGI